MLKALLDFLLNRKGHPAQHDTPALAEAPVAPYKVEPPPPVVEVKTGGEWPFPEAAKEMKPAVKAKTARTRKPSMAAMTAAEKPKKPRAKKAKE